MFSPSIRSTRSRCLPVTKPLIPILAIFGVSCGESAADGSAIATVTDSAGITIVTNDGASATVPAWSTEPDLTIGEQDGSSEYTFGQISDVDVDDARNFYVVDQQAQRALMYDPDGQFIRVFARPGEGPGELGRYVPDIHVATDKSVYIVDNWQLRVSAYEPDGTLDRTIRLDHGRRGPFQLQQLGNGALLVRWFTYNTDDEGRFVPWDVLLLSDSLRTTFDTLMAFDYRQPDLGSLGELRLPLIVNAAIYDLLEDERILWSAIEKTQLAIHARNGDLTRLIRNTTWQRRAMANAERDTVEMIYRAGRDDPDAPLPSSIRLPDSMPVITAVHASPDGGFWIQRMGSVSDIHYQALSNAANPSLLGGRTWEVYDREGRLTATVTLPPRVRVTRVLESTIIGVHKDELDVERVVRLRIIR